MEQLEKDKRIHQKIKRFKTKHAQMRHIFQEVRGRHMLKVEDVVQLLGLQASAALSDPVVLCRMRSLSIQTT